MKDTLVLIKLGGSLVTDKTKPMVFRREAVASVAEDFLELLETHKNVDFILGNGVGSFGHFPAHEYDVAYHVATARQRYGMSLTHNIVAKLSRMVAQEFTDREMPVFTISPAGLITAKDGAVGTTHLAPVEGLMSQHIVPLLHGDTLYDSVRGGVIFSTEKIFQVCLEHFRKSYETIKVIYLSDIDGVLDADRSVIAELSSHQRITVHKMLEHDISGGIAGKVESAHKAAQLADAVYIANGATPNVISRILGGEPLGTRVLG
jgi:isopentenyl phosphate kinase